jgi:hypothetical protein
MPKGLVFLPTLVIALASFGLGALSVLDRATATAPMCLESQYQEIALIELTEMKGDSLKTTINGNVRLIWNDDFVEGDGEHLVALGQLPSDHDQNFRDFAYVGNSGTMKFYPSDTYAARGTHPVKRRFFASRAEAEEQGFVASKLVK